MSESWAWVVGRVRGRFRPILAYVLAFEVVRLALLTPATAGLTRLFLERRGRASIGNFEIAAFLMSPEGLAGLLILGSLTLAILYLELAGMLRLLADHRLAWWGVFPTLAARFPRLVELGLRQLAVYVAIALPFGAGIALAHDQLWSDRDIYGLLVLQPPVFWAGVGVAGALVAGYAASVLPFVLRWTLALPALLFEPGLTAPQSLRRSEALSIGRRPWIAVVLGGWFLGQAALSAAVLGGLRWVCDAALDRVGTGLATALPATAAALALHALVVFGLGVLAMTGWAAVLLGLYREAAGHAPDLADAPPEAAVSAAGRSRVRRATVAAAGLLLLMAWVSLGLIQGLKLNDRVELTAHRAGAATAPENTVAAIRQAIVDRADWAEIDVQLTADQALVVLHDTDLNRVGGPNLPVGRATLEQVRRADIARALGFADRFPDERVPTLDEILDAAGTALPLNIELKPHDRENGLALADAVLDCLRRRDGLHADRVRICSQSYEAIRRVKVAAPEIEIGFIAGAALGDLTRLEVDFLMVNAVLATRELVERAGARGMKVHAWTVNRPDDLPRLLDRGVADVITDYPAELRARLEEIRALDPAERLLLRARNALAD